MRLLHLLTLFYLAPLPNISLCPRNSKLCLPNFCSIFLCHRRWLWQIRSLQMFWWCKGSSCHQGDGDQVSELHGLLAPQRVPYGHPNAAPKSAPNLHPGAEHFYWISHKASEHMRYKTTKIICPSWKKGREGVRVAQQWMEKATLNISFTFLAMKSSWFIHVCNKLPPFVFVIKNGECLEQIVKK